MVCLSPSLPKEFDHNQITYEIDVLNVIRAIGGGELYQYFVSNLHTLISK